MSFRALAGGGQACAYCGFCLVMEGPRQCCTAGKDYDALRAERDALERDVGTLLGMIRHQREVLTECLPYLNESMAGRRPGRSADDIRAAVKALTADATIAERKP